MIASMIRAALSQRLIVIVLSLVLCGFGLRAAMNLSVDAFPDVTNVQVQVATEAPGRSPEEIERFVTVPLEIAMTGMPGLVEMRSLNKSGLSIITLVFTDTTDVYFARQLVTERLMEVTPRMPEGIIPVLGPVSTGLGEVYQYTLDHPDDGKRALTPEELTERRTIQDWVARPLLRSIPGVAEINSQGGYVKQYQVEVDPGRLRHYGLSVRHVVQAIADNNANASGGILPQVTEQYLIRAVGLIQSLEDIGNIVLKQDGGVPVFVRDVAEVQLGQEVRQGAIIKGGYTEGVSGIVLMMRGGNAKEVVTRVKERVQEINSKGMLPGGLQIVPYYDRTDLVDSALWTVGKVLIEGILLVVVVLFVFLGDVRSSLIVVATLIITPLTTFIMMNRWGISANLMSLGGLAIAIGLMVDATVVVVENVFHKLGQAGDSMGARVRTVLSATTEVATPTIFGIAIIILVFLPLMTLQGIEGKMFGPLALTIAISLAVSLAVSLFLSPVLCSYFLKGGADHDTRLIAFLKRHYLRLLDLATARNRATLAVAVALLLGSLGLFPLLGKSFMPTMKEGALTPQINRVPSISLDESIRMEMAAMKAVAEVPGVLSVVSKLGRGESPADPAGPNESDPIVLLDPESDRTQDEIDEDIRQRLSSIPGVQIVLSQPISERVDEMVTGVRSQLAIKVFGDELDDLRDVSEQVARILKSVPGSTDIRVERLSGQQALTVDIDRKAIARHGLNVTDVQGVIESAIGGKDVTTVYEGERRYNVVVRFPEPFRGSPPGCRCHLADHQHRRAGSAQQRGPHRAGGRTRADQPRRRQAPRGGGRQRGRARPGRLRDRSAAAHRQGSATARRLLLQVRRPVREHGARHGHVAGDRAADHRGHLLPAVRAVQFGQAGRADHPGAAFRLHRGTDRPVRHGRIRERAGIGGLHCAVGHCGAQRRGAGQLHPQAARGWNGRGRGRARRLRAALPPRDDDGHRRAAGPGALPVRHRPRLGGATPAGHRRDRWPDLVHPAYAGGVADPVPLV